MTESQLSTDTDNDNNTNNNTNTNTNNDKWRSYLHSQLNQKQVTRLLKHFVSLQSTNLLLVTILIKRTFLTVYMALINCYRQFFNNWFQSLLANIWPTNEMLTSSGPMRFPKWWTPPAIWTLFKGLFRWAWASFSRKFPCLLRHLYGFR